ncbi:MAG: hypothetical protein V4615_13380, partial [Bacteroidota bacterium]
ILFALTDILLKNIKPLGWKNSNYRVSFWVIFLSFLSAEVSLRYILKTELTFTEQNGSHWYSSPYRQIHLQNILRKYVFKQEDVCLKISKPNSTVVDRKNEFSFEHHYNAIGIRERNLPRQKIDLSNVTLGLGDSFTEGVGTHQDSTWLRQLETLLLTHDKNALTINGGSNGGDVFTAYYLLEHLLYEYCHPKTIVLNINFSDINDVIIRGGYERFISHSEMKYNSAPWWETIYSFSYIFRSVMHNIFHFQWNYYTPKEFAQKKEEALEQIDSCLFHQYIPFARQKGIELVVVFSPVQSEIESNNFPYVKSKKHLISEGIVVVDLYEDFKKQGGKMSDYFWKTDLHNNAKGYGVWANAIHQELGYGRAIARNRH